MFVIVIVANAYSFDESITRQLYWLKFSYDIGSRHMGTIDKWGH